VRELRECFVWAWRAFRLCSRRLPSKQHSSSHLALLVRLARPVLDLLVSVTSPATFTSSLHDHHLHHHPTSLLPPVRLTSESESLLLLSRLTPSNKDFFPPLASIASRPLTSSIGYIGINSDQHHKLFHHHFDIPSIRSQHLLLPHTLTCEAPPL